MRGATKRQTDSLSPTFFNDRYGSGAAGTDASTRKSPRPPLHHLAIYGATVAMRSKKKIVLGVLLASVVVLAGLLVRGYLKYREFRENPAKIIAAIPEGPNIVLGEVRHTAVREGRKEWVLEAASAQYSESSKEAVFNDVKVTFFMDNGDKVHLEGQKGTINTASNDMQVAGNVRVEKDEQTLLTEMIEYNHETRYLTSPSEVRILGRNFDLRADRMQVDLATETALFTGAVEGKIDAAHQLTM